MSKATTTAQVPGTIPVLDASKTQCTIGGLTLIVGSTVDYKSAIEEKISIGEIKQFMYAGYGQSDRDSVWMRVHDMGKDTDPEWISVAVWYEQFLNRKKPAEALIKETPVKKNDKPF